MSYWLILCLIGTFLPLAVPHGRLVKPPGRSSAWRYGFKTPTNYNDHELFCGGFSKQWISNKGKCGLCGDAWNLPRPRANEHGGHYGTGVIVGEYSDGGTIEIIIQLTANHRGFFEFRICPHNSLKNLIPEHKNCFDKYLLSSIDGQDRYAVVPNKNNFNLSYRLPKGLTCAQCVLQWRYVAGNNWNMCGNGTGKAGCGPQEEFRSCADIRITNEGIYDDTQPDIRLYDIVTPDSSSKKPIVPKDSSNKTVDTSREVENNLEDSIYSLNPIPHSKTGQIIAIVVAVLTSLLILLALFVIYLWERKLFAIKRLKRRDSWWPQFFRWTNVDPFRKTTTPIPPPRSRRPKNLTNHVSPSVINISNPTSVTVNGLPIPTIRTNVKVVPKP